MLSFHSTRQSTASLPRAGILFLFLLTLAACSNMTQQQQRVLSGAAIGTAVGAGTTVMTGGCVSCGAAIGGAVGAGAGYLYDKDKR